MPEDISGAELIPSADADVSLVVAADELVSDDELDDVLLLLLLLLLELPHAAVMTRTVVQPRAATVRDAVQRICGCSFRGGTGRESTGGAGPVMVTDGSAVLLVGSTGSARSGVHTRITAGPDAE